MFQYLTILENNHKEFAKKLNEAAKLGGKVINSYVFRAKEETQHFYALMEIDSNLIPQQ